MGGEGDGVVGVDGDGVVGVDGEMEMEMAGADPLL